MESPVVDDSSPVDGRIGARALASGESPNPVDDVLGRDEELTRIRGLLADARAGRSGALLVEGAAGIGKTTLLNAGRSLATGCTCLSATGVASESVLAHAGLLELLNPVRDLLPEVAGAQGAALGSALGWVTDEGPADRFLVGAATLSLLAAAAARGPVLVVVDDLHWLDRESAAAILFAARRMGPDAVAFMFATRPSSLSTDVAQGIPVLQVAGLRSAAASRLVPPSIASSVVDRLVAGTEGNPLALLEVSSRLNAAQRVGAAPLPDPLPVGERLQTVYGSLLSGLSADAWRAVLLLAVAPGSSAAAASAFDREGGEAAAALDEAREHGVLVADEHGLSSGILSYAPPCCAWRRRLSSDAHTTRSPTRSRPGPPLAPGIWRRPRSASTTASPTSWPGSQRRTGFGWASRLHRRPSKGPPS